MTVNAVNIAGIGTYFPSDVRRNSDFDYVGHGVAQHWVDEAGISERRWAGSRQTIVDLAQQAALRALRCAGMSASEIDRIFLVTSSMQSPLLVPCGATRLQNLLGIEKCVSMTLVETCGGALMAMDLAAAAIRCGQARNALVVAAETFSKTFNPTSEATFKIGMSMGDGAGAVVLTGRNDWEDGQLGSFVSSDPCFVSGLGMRPRVVWHHGQPEASVGFGFGGAPPSMHGKLLPPDTAMDEIKQYTIKMVPAAIREVLQRAKITMNDIDFVSLHQPNRRFVEAWKKQASVPENKTLDTLAKYGNLSSVSVLANLDTAFQHDRIKPEGKVLLCSVGEGSIGAAVWRWRIARNPDHDYLLQEKPEALADRLVVIEKHSMATLWEKFIMPGVKDAYAHEELFSDFIPSMAVFEGVPIEGAFEFLSKTENLGRWTMTMRNIRLLKGDIYAADEDASPTGKVFVRTTADAKAKTIGWDCSHSDPDDLWMLYRGLLVDAGPALGRKGTAFMWSNFMHERVKKDPMLSMGFRAMFSAHSIEIGNLKMILEDMYKAN